MTVQFNFPRLQDLSKFRRDAPRVAGNIARDFFKQSFRRQGFIEDNSVQKWPNRKGQQDKKKRAVLVKTGRLRRSIRIVRIGEGYVTVGTSGVPYAQIHNEGGTTHPTVTPRMRKYAYYRYMQAGGSGSLTKGGKKRAMTSAAQFWLNLARTKKSTLTVTIPKRQFMGNSNFLNKRIIMNLEYRLRKILM